jgi:hypothetical protein
VARTFSKPQRFQSTVEGQETSRVFIRLTFDPASKWGARERYHVAGTINGCSFRGVVEQAGKSHVLAMGAAWRRGTGLKPGDRVDATLAIEGPQRDELPADIAQALNGEPEAAAFFDSLAGFYVQNYLRWIAATKRSPETRVERIKKFVKCMKAGIKDGAR